MIDLSPNASALSHQRAQMAAELVRGCPEELGREVYLYGSVAKGYADPFSDIELTFLVDEVREPGVYEGWLRSRGATVDPATMAWGGGYTTKSCWAACSSRQPGARFGCWVRWSRRPAAPPRPTTGSW